MSVETILAPDTPGSTMDLREGSRPPPLWAYGSEEEEDHLLGEDPRRTKPVRQLYDATQTPASPPPPDLPAIATLVPEARLRASPCYSTSEEEDVPAFITGSPAHEYSTSEDEDHAALVGPAARAKFKAGDALRSMLAAVADPDGSPAATRGDEPGRYVSDEGVKAYQAVGANLVARVDSAMSGEMRHELARIASKGDAPHETELEARVKALEAENKLLKQKHQVAELKGLELRKRLDDVMAERYRDGQRSIDAEIEKREFRDAILELVMDLRDGIVKRLGFIPASTQAEINAFISTLADTEKADARAAVAAAAASLPGAPAKARGPPPPPPRP